MNVFSATEHPGSDFVDRLLHRIEGIAAACKRAELEQLVKKFRQLSRTRVAEIEGSAMRIHPCEGHAFLCECSRLVYTEHRCRTEHFERRNTSRQYAPSRHSPGA